MHRLYKITVIFLFFISKKLYFDFIGVKCGSGCRFVGLTRSTFGSEPYLVEFGNNVTVSSGVQFITHDGSVAVLRNQYPDIDLIEPIKIGDNVFIGHGSIILAGTVVGDNVIIGAGSVVKGVISPNGVYAGVPVKYIKTLDDYTNRILPKVVQTKNLSFAAKKAFIKSKYDV